MNGRQMSNNIQDKRLRAISLMALCLVFSFIITYMTNDAIWMAFAIVVLVFFFTMRLLISKKVASQTVQAGYESLINKGIRLFEHNDYCAAAEIFEQAMQLKMLDEQQYMLYCIAKVHANNNAYK